MSDALKQLTDKQSDAVELCILREMSQRDAAKETRIPVGTLCCRLKAAKERLKEILPTFIPRHLNEHYNPSARAS